MKVLVTGIAGFIDSNLVEQITMHAWQMTTVHLDIGSLDPYHEACEKLGE